MPLGNDAKACLRALGRSVKEKAKAGEQFCVFAFDCDQHDELIPPPEEIEKDDLPFSSFDTHPNWSAAFYSVVGPTHTERAVLDTIGNWLNAYESIYDTVGSVYIYSRLIPCLRDGCHGHCSDAIAAFMLWFHKQGRRVNYYIGWGNDDRDSDMAHAIKTALADLEDDDISVELFSKISIAD